MKPPMQWMRILCYNIACIWYMRDNNLENNKLIVAKINENKKHLQQQRQQQQHSTPRQHPNG